MPTFSLDTTPANSNLPAMHAPVPATAADVLRLLGDVDPMIVARVLATNASVEEIGEALTTVEDEAGFGEAPHQPSSFRVSDVIAILDEGSIFDGDVDFDFDAYQDF